MLSLSSRLTDLCGQTMLSILNNLMNAAAVYIELHCECRHGIKFIRFILGDEVNCNHSMSHNCVLSAIQLLTVRTVHLIYVYCWL